MTASRTWLLFFLLLCASWLQAGVSNRMAIFHARPDIILTTLICMSILVGSFNGIVLSIWGGFLTAVLAGYNYGSVLISRLVTGALAGVLQQHVIQDNIVIPPVTIFFATWIDEGVYFLMAPDLHSFHWWVHMVVGESLYNAALSLPIYFGLRLLNYGTENENGYNPFIETI